MNKDLNEVLNYMKQYVENIYEHDSEPMLTWKNLKLVLEEIERLENIIKEVRGYIDKPPSLIYKKECGRNFKKILEILDKGKE